MGHAREEEVPCRWSMQCGIRRTNAADGRAAFSIRGHSHTRWDLEATYASWFIRRHWDERADVAKTGRESCRVACGYGGRKTKSRGGMSENRGRHSLDWRS